MESQTQEDQKSAKLLIMINCLLCKCESTALYFENENHRFFHCSECDTVFRDPKTFLSPSEEKERYLTHNNDVSDTGYREFVSPITEAVVANYGKFCMGLDFGAGTGPVIAEVLKEQGYTVELYDPFFHPDVSVLEANYDFIVCCEVIEHFFQPEKEFSLLKKLLKPGGKLFCMTDLLTENDFEDWYYKNDPSHVIFYNANNLKWIVENIGFSKVETNNRLVIFSV